MMYDGDLTDRGFMALGYTASDRGIMALGYTALLLLIISNISPVNSDTQRPCSNIPISQNSKVIIDETTLPGTVLQNWSSVGEIYTVSPKTDLSITKDGDKYSLVLLRDVDLDNSSNVVEDFQFKITCISGSDSGIFFRGTVIILPVDEYAPQFSQLSYSVNVNEMIANETSIFIPSATDKDYKDRIDYSILDGTDHFALKGSTTSGVIVNTKLFDYDSGQRLFNITLIATDNAGQKGYADLFVHIQDFDDQSPRFGQLIYRLTVKEKTTYPEALKTDPALEAHDLDFGINATVTYFLESGSSFFTVDLNNGKIRVHGTLDVNIADEYLLEIKAAQTDNPTTRFDRCTVIVTVQDINNNSPQMNKTVYSVSINENSAKDSPILQMAAYDLDKGDNAVFEYHLIDPSGAFDINPQTGKVKVKTSAILDREAHVTLQFQVYAKETLTIAKHESQQAHVTVTLLDVNDNSPVFHPAMYDFTVNSTIKTGELIGMVSAVDADVGSNAVVRYSVLYSSISDYISLNDISGRLSLTKNLPVPTKSSYEVTIKATDQDKVIAQRRNAVTTVRINVNMENSHPPVFSTQTYTVSIPENEPTGTYLTQLSATDRDGDALTYTVAAGNVAKKFLLNGTSGVLLQVGRLDREEKSTYHLSVQCSDGKNIATSTVKISVLDENDNPPIFVSMHSSFSIAENTLAPTTLGAVKATDQDIGVNGNILYSLSPMWSDTFKIDPASGSLSTKVSLDYEVQSSYQVTVYAHDLGTPSLTGTTLVNLTVQDVNDNAPRFRQGINNVSITLREASQPIDFFQATAVDLDQGANAEVVYSISAGNGSIFSINPTSGEISARLPLIITTADSRVLVLQIRATNTRPYTLTSLKAGKLNILVYIQDVNNRPAVFTQASYTFHVNENVMGPIPGGRVFATDADLTPQFQSIRYWINHSTTPIIAIDEKSGQLRLLEAADYDPPANQHNFTLTVSAGNYLPDVTGVFINSTVEVIIQIHDVNDNTPQFSADSYYVTMPENRNVPYITGLVVSAEDLDGGANGDIEYYLNDYQNAFNFSVDSGKLLVIKPLDYDLGPHGYTVPIVARDKGHPFRMNSTYIYVNITNINDNAPRFLEGNLSFSVDEDVLAGFRIGQVIAEDIDGDRLTYTIVGNMGPFAISSDGWLSLKRYPLNLTIQTLYHLRIRVYDGIYRRETTVNIKVNDVNHHSPIFDAKSFSCHVLENTNTQFVIRPVCKVNATDKDAGKNGAIVYTISPASVAARFHISQNGEIESAVLLDREKQDLYVLIVTATDEGANARKTSVYVNVTIDDVNDNPPVFSNVAYLGTVKENSSPGASVAMIPAIEFSDPDALDDGHLVVTLEGLDSNYFTFQSATNTISVSAHAVGVHKLDREKKAQYNFMIVVTDTGNHNATSTITIDLLDVVDTKPSFSSTKYSFAVHEDASPTRSLGPVNATDPDLEPLLHYTVPPPYPFYIPDETGVLHVAGILDRENIASYNFTITVTNQAQLEDTAEVIVTVLDVNDNPPVITQPAPFTFAEDQPPGSTVGNLMAHDADQGINGEFTFFMHASDTFSISRTGVIQSVKVIDRDTLAHPFFDLTVYASDKGHPSLTSSVTVQIDILNINDNAPSFSSAQFNFSIDEDAIAGTSIAQLEAADGDGDKLKYALKPSDPIIIDPDTGWLILHSAPLNLSKRAFYDMRATVSDPGNQTDMADVHISVNDVNFHSPVFNESSVNCHVYENEPINTNICIVKATDKDSGKNGIISYSVSPEMFSGLFTVSQKGQIKTNKILDTEKKASYMLIIVATDHGANPRQSNCYVTVNVIDVNDNKVKFTHPTYNGTIKENAHTGAEVVFIPPIDFSDADSAVNEKLTVQLQGTDSQYFDFNLNTKIVSVSTAGNGKLDREAKATYQLTLVITDPQGQNSSTDLVVDLLDEVDTTPVFLRHRYTFNVSEGDSTPVHLGAVSAMDSDLTPVLRYALTDSNIPFYIVDTTGELYVAGRLDRETVSSYVYNVTVQNEAGLEDVAEVNISVLDVNDNAPSINKSQTSFNFTEEQPAGTSVGSLTASDPDEGQNGVVTFALLETDMFKITSNGDIQSSVVIDYDTLTIPVFDVPVLARDGGQPSLTSSIMIRVRILNINDNAPVFQSAIYNFSVDENAAAGARIGQLEAVDADRDALSYSLDQTDIFSIDAKSAWIFLHQAPLNLRTAAFYDLTVTVTDAVHNVSASVHVTINDVNLHSPVFAAPPTSCHVDENDASQQLDVHVCTLTADDKDTGKNGALTYSLLPNRMAGLFNITLDGIISTAGILDREVQDSYNLIVTATDHGVNARKTSVYLTVHIDDINDNIPSFSSSEYRGTIKENAPAGTSVTVIPPVKYHDADSSDRGKLIVHLRGDDSSYFTFNNVTNIISVSVIGDGKLDRETKPIYQLEIVVTDTANHNATSTITIDLLDIVDTKPSFSSTKYSFAVHEDASPTRSLGFVNATDPDLEPLLHYTVPPPYPFYIPDETGVLHVAGILDRENIASYNFTITVTNQAQLEDTAEVTVTVLDVNDNPPVITQPAPFTFTEDQPPGSTVGNLTAHDADQGTNGEFTFFMHASDTFSISSTGVIQSVKVIDRDTLAHPFFDLTVYASDKGHPSLTSSITVLIDILNINDNAPSFSSAQFNFSIDEDAIAGTSIAQLEAADGDGDKLKYALKPSDPIIIDPDTGWLILHSAPLNLSKRAFYDMRATVSDPGNQTDMADVRITVNDVNDHSPVFNETSVNCDVHENKPINTNVCIVKATDKDSGKNGIVSYSVSPEMFSGLFTISQKGQIKTNKILDTEKRASYMLIIVATDHGANPRQSTCYVTVNVINVNDNKVKFTHPTYNGTIKENAHTGTEVVFIPPIDFSDADSAVNEKLTVQLQGTDSQYFDFNLNTKIVSVSTAGNGKLDREAKATYQLTLVITDPQGQNSTTDLVVDLLDEVDTTPVFLRHRYTFNVSEGDSTPVRLGAVSAMDSDLTPVLRYALTDSNIPFYIVDTTGELYVAGRLDRETVSSYVYNVTVQNEAGLEDVAEVNISVLDVNDNAPSINKSQTSFNFTEEQPAGTSVGSLTASDPDEGQNGVVTFALLETDMFKITSNGDIQSSVVIDYDTLTIPFFDVPVLARDGGQPSLTSSIMIRVRILNINDNAPVFQSAIYNFSVDENVAAGARIGQLEAVDADRDALSYSLDQTDIFSIDAKSAWIFLHQAPLNLRTASYYDLTVTVTDAVHNVSADVRITVNDVNFHSPVFNESSVNCDVYENKPINTNVCIVKATDKDSGKNGIVSYSVSPEVFSGLFTISQKGQIKTNKILDMEKRASYMLIIVATDHGANPRQSNCYVTVNVIDVNDNKVKFTHPTYNGTIKENAHTGTEVVFIPPIAFSDADSAVNEKLTAQLQGTDSQYFDFNLNTKIVSVSTTGNGKLDREAKATYQLTLVITDPQGQNSSTDLVVDLLDEVDTTPVFLHHQYTFNVSEGDSTPVRLGAVSAMDSDLTPVLRYALSDSNIPFYIVDTTGELYVAGRLDRETVSSYVYNVTVQNEAGLKDEAEVNISVLDVNDNAPSINKSQTSFNFTEEQPAGTSVGSLTASDPDEGQNGVVTFVLLETDMFKITSNGDIQSSVVIDYDTLTVPFFDVPVLARDGGQPSLTSSIMIRVRILNINDNAPVFQSAIYNFSVDENAATETRIGQLEAVDADRDALSYSLDQTDIFSIDAKSAWIFLHQAPLNLKTAAFYDMTVTVTDAVHNVSASVHVTINDVNLHSPVFAAPPTSCHVDENDASQQLDAHVCTLTAEDKDTGKNGALTYSLLPNRMAGLFNVTLDGIISTAGILDREVQDSYNLIVTATDHGVNARKTSVYLTVHIDDINDNIPLFSSSEYSGTIKENAPAGTSVTVIPPVKYHDADSSDQGKLIVHLRGDDSSYFTFNNVTNIISVSVIGDGKLDRETKPLYQLELIVTDTAGHQTVSNVSIALLDVVDSRPIFKSHLIVFNVPENQPLGNKVGSVSADDADLAPALRYAIATDGVPFYIAELTGDIFVSGHLDREVMANFSFNVTVRNKASLQDAASVEVIVLDINDNAPLISTSGAPFLFKEEQPAGALVGEVLATDPDEGENGRVTLFMNETDYFNITATGSIQSTVKIDREQLTKPFFSITVFAVDHGSPPLSSSVSVQITIEDINDHKPTFCEESKCGVKVFYANVVEKAPIGSIIALIRTKDDDAGKNGAVKLSLQGPTAGFFAMDPTLGVIMMKKSIDFNLLINEGFINATVSRSALVTLEIVASDGGQPPLSSTAELRVEIGEINDQTPVFTESIYKWSVAENQDSGTIIGRVSASVRNATNIQLAYSTVNTDFHVDSLGNVSTARMFDRETVASYIMAIKVTDGRLPERTAYCVVMITVTDVNDNPPVFVSTQFTASIVENKASTIHTFTATDADSGTNAKIVYSLVDGIYDSFVTVNNKTGELDVKATVDREKTPTLWIDIMAKDMGSPPMNSTTRVTFIVQDVNDNKPEFYGSPYNASVIFDESLQNVLTIFANDSDVGLNGSVTYRIQPLSRNGPFVINEITGQIQCIAANMYRYQSQYMLIVDAQDLGSPPQKNSVTVTIYMTSVDKPQFVPKLRQVMVPESTTVGGNFLNLTAGGGEYQYNITDGNKDDYFHLDSVNGHLSLTKSLEGHRGDFLLTVMATDMKSLFSDTLKVVILIVNTVPTFLQDSYHASVLENSNPPVLVVDLNTTLELSGQPVVYSFTHKSDIFSLNTSSGQVYCMKKLDREQASSYVIEVRAGRPTSGKRRKRAAIDPSLARVSITVGDVNDNPPRFGAVNESFIIGIPASFTTYYLVTEMVAHDPDEGINGAVAYTITGGDSNLFSINAENGEIRTKVGDDKVNRRKFLLNITATDQMGKGLSTNATVEIVVVSDSDMLVLVAAIKPSMFNSYTKIITSNMSAILGYDIKIEKHVPHVELTSDGSYVNVDITDMYFYAMDHQTHDVVPREKVFAKMKENHAAISEFFTRLNLLEVKPLPIIHPPYMFTEAEIALLAVSLIILIGSLVGIAVVCFSYRRRKSELLKHEQAVKAREKAHDFPVTALNPLYKGMNKDSESGDAMELSVLTREFEIQEQTMDVLDEEILTTNIDDIVPYIITSTDTTSPTSEGDRSPDVTQNKVNFTGLPDLLNKDAITRISIDPGASSDEPHSASVHEELTLPDEAAESTEEGNNSIYINLEEEARKTEQPGASAADATESESDMKAEQPGASTADATESESDIKAEQLSTNTSLPNVSDDVSHVEQNERQQISDAVPSSDDSKMGIHEPSLNDGGDSQLETGHKSETIVSSDIPQTPPYTLHYKPSIFAGSEIGGDAAAGVPLMSEDDTLLYEVMQSLRSIGNDQEDDMDSLNQSQASSVVVDIITHL